jgi:hypothetical protein
VPLSSLTRDSFLLLPRPYPGFLPLYFKSESTVPFKLKDAERLEFRWKPAGKTDEKNSIEISEVWFEK